MSYTLNCYKNTEENIVVNKSLPTPIPLSLSCELKYGVNLRSPVITVGTSLATMKDYNYFHIPELGRYYFRTDIKGVANNLVEISLNCDLLMSFKNEFLTSEAIIERQSYRGNVYVPDSLYPIESRTRTVTKKFPSALSSSASMVLITIG